MSSGHCDAVNPDTGDQCQEARGHRGGHYVTRVDRWETPYRMAEPENVGAVVVSGGFRLVRIWEVGHNWADLRTGKQYRWVNITNPEPFQNCTLTADDPEPPIGSVVHHGGGTVSKRYPCGWLSIGLKYSFIPWEQEAITPVTLLYRGEA